jgi:hypothetical protein
MWLGEYNRLMFKQINNNEETIQAINIKNQNMPEIVYKYRAVCPHTINALENGFLMASSPSSLNDPNEGKMFVDYHNRWKLIYQGFLETFYERTGFRLAVEIDQYEERDGLFNRLMECLSIPKEDFEMWNQLWIFTDELLKEKLIEFQNELINLSDELHRICSFSEVRDSILMWTHYADELRGFCVGYNLKELNNDLTDLLLPVRYSDSLIEVDDTFFDGGEANKSLLMNSLTLKSSAWQIEKEWRLLLIAENTEKKQEVRVPVPKEIILGLNITSENQIRLIGIATAYNIACYKIFKESNSFQYRFEKVN